MEFLISSKNLNTSTYVIYKPWDQYIHCFCLNKPVNNHLLFEDRQKRIRFHHGRDNQI